MNNEPPHVRDETPGRRLRATLALGALLPSFDLGLAAVALPSIARHFTAGSDGVSWVVVMGLLLQGSFLPFFIRLAERQGVKKTYVAGLVVFIAGAGLAFFAPRLTDLVVGRVVQGTGTAMLLSAVLAPALRPAPRPASLRPGPSMIGTEDGSVVAGTAGGLAVVGTEGRATIAGLALGAALGGVIAAFGGWRYVFLAGVPIALAAVVLGFQALPRRGQEPGSASGEPAPPQAHDSPPGEGASKREAADPGLAAPELTPPIQSWTGQSYDGWGAFHLFALCIALVFVIQQGQSMGWTSAAVLIGVGAIPLFAFAFVRRERRHPEPLFDLKALRGRGPADTLAACLLFCAALGGVLFILPFFVEHTLGAAAWLSGLVVAVHAASQAPAERFARLRAGRSREAGGTGAVRRLCLLAAFLAAGGFIVAAVFLTPLPEPFAAALALTLAAMVLVGVAGGLFAPAVRFLRFPGSTSLAPTTRERLVHTSSLLGLALGVAAFETAARLTASSEALGSGDAPALHELSAGAARSAFAVGLALCLLVGVVLTMLGSERPSAGAAGWTGTPGKPHDED